jgi:hypothetical protein
MHVIASGWIRNTFVSRQSPTGFLYIGHRMSMVVSEGDDESGERSRVEKRKTKHGEKQR